MLPGDASVVASMLRASLRQRAKNGRAASSACDSAWPAMRMTRVITRDCAGARRQPLARKRFDHRLQLARRTRQKHDDRSSCSSHSPGAVPFGFGTISAPSGTIACRRLMSGICSPRLANRAAERSTVASSSPHRAPERLGDDVPRQVIVGRAEAAREHDEIRASKRRREDGAEVLARVSDDRLRAHADAVLGQALGDEQRVGIETRRRQQLAADGDDFRAENGTHAFRLQQPAPVQSRRRARSARFAYIGRHHVVSHHAHPAVKGLEAARGYGLITSSTRKTKNPAITTGPRRRAAGTA